MIRVLVVDDQPVVAQGHARWVERVPGFRAIGLAYNGRAAIERCKAGGVDLVLLDLTMPGIPGLKVIWMLKALPQPPDVIVLTVSRDLQTVQAAVRAGALHYVVKPFSFPTLRAKLIHYAKFADATAGNQAVVDQGEIDAALAALRDPNTTRAKGISKETLAAIRDALLAAPAGLSSTNAAEAVGVSRVTARRYLEYLADNGGCEREPVYGHTGRPELLYHITTALAAACAKDAR